MNFSKSSKKSNINLTTALVANNASKDGKKVMLHGRLEVHIDQAKGIISKCVNTTVITIKLILMRRHRQALKLGTLILGLPNMDRGSLTDAFVAIKMDHDTPLARTQVVVDSLDPKFNESYRLDVCHRIEEVVLVVYDQDSVTNEKIGMVKFKAKDLLDGVQRKQEDGYPIKSRTRSEKGRLFLSIKFICCSEIEKEPYDTDGYFDTKQNCRMTLYQDAHVPKCINSENAGGMQKICPNSCWNDLYSTLVEAQSLICITGWSVWTKLKLFRGEDSKTDERSLGEILVDKANRGVKVYVMVWDEADAAQKIVGMGTHDEETYNYFQTTSK